MEKTPSTSLTLITAFRVSDGVILGGKYQFSGRSEVYDGRFSGPKVSRISEGREFGYKHEIPVTKEGLKAQIDQAVERGVKWLKTQQVDGTFMDRGGYAVGTAQGIGSTAMALLALLHSGVPADDPLIKKGFSYIASKKVNQSYDLALYLMALEGKYLPMSMLEDLEKYSEERAREELRSRLSKDDREAAERAVLAILQTQSEVGLFGYAGGAGYPNMSSTQYAILGLKSAARMGIQVPLSVWSRTLDYLQDAKVQGQEITVDFHRRNGKAESRYSRVFGWGYSSPKYPQPTGTMTAAALSTVAVCTSELTRANSLSEKGIQSAKEQIIGAASWLQQNYNLRAGTPEGCVYGAAMAFYYLYGVERALILADIKTLGGHDWFLEGSAILSSGQKPDGRWEGAHGTPVIDTAFALLFLKKATLPVVTGVSAGKAAENPK